jgi:uncharacterized membrane protein HdeD (DUF308 family)
MLPAPQTPTDKLKFAQDEVRPLKDQWIWFLVLGILIVVLGVAAIAVAPFTAVATVALFGLILVATGIAQAITAFWSAKWSGVTLNLIIGILYVVIGVMIIDHPLQAAGGFAILVAAIMIVGGVIRIVTSIREQFFGWAWTLLNGVISLLLGMAIISHFPASITVIGIFVGLDLIFAGAAWILFAFGLRRLAEFAEQGASPEHHHS